MTGRLVTVLLFCIFRTAAFQAPFEPGVPGGTLRVAQKAEPKTLNPLVAIDAPSREVIRLLHADLITINRYTQRTEPALAESWKAAKDGRSFTLALRKGVHFSDGHPFDADDVIFTFQVYTDKAVAAPQRDLLMVGEEPVRVRKTGSHTVVVTLSQPYAAAERIFDGIAILPRHLLEADYRAGRLAKIWTVASTPQSMAGLGPFRFREHKAGEWIRLDRNPYYWKSDANRRRLPYFDEVVLRATGTEENQVIRFLAGELDVLGRLAARSYAAIEQKALPDVQLVDAGSSLEYNVAFFNLNTSAPAHVASKQTWFGDKRFRQALSLAADREGMARLVYGGRATPLWGHVPPGNRIWAAQDIAKPPRSIPAAKQILTQVGFQWDSAGRLLDRAGTPVRFTIVVSSSNSERSRLATILASDWRELGIDVQVVPLEFRALLDRLMNSKDYDACLLGFGGGDADPNPEMNIWLSSGSMHFWNPQQKSPATPWEARLDELMRRQMTTTDFAARHALFREVQQIVAGERPVISLVSPNVLVAARRSVGNFRPAILDSYALWNAEYLYRVTSTGGLGQITKSAQVPGKR
ncbi:MAG: ABC transporter substrate-binding protein [Acidobacteria bacterium]|nr:ABC transporter substrate-binding protein [Acidobacteriota bacterium]